MYELRLTSHAESDLRALDAGRRAGVIEAMRIHLSHQLDKVSNSRIKRLRDLKLPQYRLRVDDVRVYYDIGDGHVMIHGIIPKDRTLDWLSEHGITDDQSTTESS